MVLFGMEGHWGKKRIDGIVLEFYGMTWILNSMQWYDLLCT